jgi:hypothetical protein
MKQSTATVAWPELPLESWRDTRDTLHRLTQIVGKIRLALTPLVNHWWNTALYVSPRGLTTSKMPCSSGRSFDVEFDFVAHVLRFRVSDGAAHDVPLGPRSVADLYRDIFNVLRLLDIQCLISPIPSEIPDETPPLDRDDTHRHYDPEAVQRFWQILSLSEDVFTAFRARFLGKCSPVNFYWGSFDLAVTRFSGRPAPPRPEADAITREAYSHEVSSVGFWPGDSRVPFPAYYSYAAPQPAGFATARVRPPGASYAAEAGYFLLPYDDVRRAADPAAMLLDFCQSTYEAAATLGGWDRASLER